MILVSLAQWVGPTFSAPLTCCPLPLCQRWLRGLDIYGITQTVGAEVSKLSHAWILRYKTCLYAPVEDFMVAGGMWRKMIASRYQREREQEGRRTPSKSGEWQEADMGLCGPFEILRLLGKREGEFRSPHRRRKHFEQFTILGKCHLSGQYGKYVLYTLGVCLYR